RLWRIFQRDASGGRRRGACDRGANLRLVSGCERGGGVSYPPVEVKTVPNAFMMLALVVCLACIGFSGCGPTYGGSGQPWPPGGSSIDTANPGGVRRGADTPVDPCNPGGARKCNSATEPGRQPRMSD